MGHNLDDALRALPSSNLTLSSASGHPRLGLLAGSAMAASRTLTKTLKKLKILIFSFSFFHFHPKLDKFRPTASGDQDAPIRVDPPTRPTQRRAGECHGQADHVKK
jgi:hypothetical protein